MGCASATSKPVMIAEAPKPATPEDIIIYEYKFVPSTLTVPVGTTVTWTNYDIAPHTATYRSYSDEAFDTGNMGAQEIYRHKFRTAGTYDYICVYHQGMRGTIVVQ
jgi:plastocyanin